MSTLCTTGHSAAYVIAAYRAVRVNPNIRANEPDRSGTYAVRAWLRQCLANKINRDLDAERATWRKWHRDWQSDVRVDRNLIEDYLYRRYRSTGCRGLLRTVEMRRRYPHINTQPREE